MPHDTEKLFKISIASLPDTIKTPLKNALPLYSCVRFFNDYVVIHDNPDFDTAKLAWAMNEIRRRGIIDEYFDGEFYNQMATRGIVSVLNDGCAIESQSAASLGLSYNLSSSFNHIEIEHDKVPIRIGTEPPHVINITENEFSSSVLSEIEVLLNEFIGRYDRDLNVDGITVPAPNYRGKLIRRGEGSYLWVPITMKVLDKAFFHEDLKLKVLKENGLLLDYYEDQNIIHQHMNLFMEGSEPIELDFDDLRSILISEEFLNHYGQKLWDDRPEHMYR